MTATSERVSTALADRYRLERELGAGGMATVFLAEDLRHDRKVAIKVLKPELAAVLGAERFVQEIKTTAALQHPHILPLFDSGEAGGFLYYVMPYIEGETIREALNRETQLGVDAALRIATQVADALEYAHRRGVIHRDIKPENILLHDGRPMVMDFGIALAVSAAAGGRMTETGLSLGTPHYMSPEQATADRTISARSDVYSLASVCYEMLTGEPPHMGTSAQQIIMKIIAEPAKPATELRRSIPPHVSDALAKALEKLPADRFESAKAFAEALANAAFRTSAVSASRTRTVASSRAILAWATLLALAGVATGLWGWQQRHRSADAPVVPLTLDTPSGNADLARFAVSPDGTRFAFTTDEGLAVRDAGQRSYRVLPGTQDAESPSFSPDGEWLVFQVRGLLRKVALSGGAPTAVMRTDSLLAGRVRWGADGSIAFEARSGIYLIPAGSRDARHLTKARTARAPRPTPDGKGLLYIDLQRGSRLMYYELATDSIYTVLEEASEADLLRNGYLLYTLPTGGLFGARFDAATHTVNGTPLLIAADLEPNSVLAPFIVSTNGTLVYRAGVEPEYRVLVREPDGRVDSLPLAPRVMSFARLSPDGRMLALTIGAARSTTRNIVLFDRVLGTTTQFTRTGGGGHAPIWSADGRQLAFTEEGTDTDAEDLFVQPLDRSRPPLRVARLPNDQHASAWPNDTTLVFSSNNVLQVVGGSSGAAISSNATVSIVNPRTPDSPRAYLAADWNQSDVAVSPDGQWAAFTSSESGTPEVLVRRFPDAARGGTWKVSTTGGQRPRWSGDGRTIYYQTLDNGIIQAVGVTPGAVFTVGSSVDLVRDAGLGPGWDVDRITGRLVFTRRVGGEAARIIVMQHWLAQFERDMAARTAGRPR
jgi:eukaryotic-like serine/threonine-protein kinase